METEYIEPAHLKAGEKVNLCYSTKDGTKPGWNRRYKKATVIRNYPRKRAALLEIDAGYKTFLSYWHLERMLNGKGAVEEE